MRLLPFLQIFKVLRLTGVCTLLAALNTAASASPWPQPQGSGILITKLDYFKSTSCLNALCDDESTFNRLDTTTYGEYGLFNNVTLTGKFSYGQTWVTFLDQQSSRRGVTNAELGVQHTFRQRRGVWSARALVALPPDNDSGVRSAFVSDDIDLEAAILYGANLRLSPRKLFFAGDIAYRKRLGGAADLIKTQTTIGYEATNRLLLLGEVLTDISLRNESAGGADYDVVKLQPSAVYSFSPRWSFQIGVSEEISGRNIATGRSFFIGLWTRF